MTVYYIDSSGRWSGGGSVVLNNLLAAAAVSDGLLVAEPQLGAVPIIPRNVPTSWRQLVHPFVWMPQNALPWGPAAPAERSRQIQLRLGSAVASRRSMAMVRISSALPSKPWGLTSPVLHNVLDREFENCLKVTTPDAPSIGFLSAGSGHSYRNLARLTEGYATYRRCGGRTPLMLQMSSGTASEEFAIVAKARLVEGLTVTSRNASREEVVGLMRRASAVIFPSYIEASPVTVLEAMAIGIPIACSQIIAHRELCDERSIYFDPNNVLDIAKALRRLDATPPMIAGPLQDRQVRTAERARWIAELLEFLARIA